MRLAITPALVLAVMYLSASPALATPATVRCSNQYVFTRGPEQTKLLSTRDISCHNGFAYLAAHFDDKQVPFKRGRRTHLGTLTCRLLRDETSAGSDPVLIVGCASRKVWLSYQFTVG
jgi:hypothetical protein